MCGARKNFAICNKYAVFDPDIFKRGPRSSRQAITLRRIVAQALHCGDKFLVGPKKTIAPCDPDNLGEWPSGGVR